MEEEGELAAKEMQEQMLGSNNFEQADMGVRQADEEKFGTLYDDADSPGLMHPSLGMQRQPRVHQVSHHFN